MDRLAVASMIDHTLLAPEAVMADLDRLCDDGRALGVAAVCVHPRHVSHVVARLGGAVPVAAVVGFPSGAHRSDVKAFEAAHAVEDGATELDMVIALGAALDGRWAAVASDIAAVRAAAPAPIVLKVIVESAALDDEALVRACQVAVNAGADFVKTSTGFHPTGGATIGAVRSMRAAVGPDIGVKASGGIRDAATALAMIEAGASRIGASASAAILDGL
ncbi:deoxyribose-phosphate aldolase [Actinospongicola halichondriae]|uniref:deoxyribose-phosphate aldolase n=1 Tax=Actinospongicola halichondriae TaxID=3236844 RepID=UPI003D411D47